MKLHLQRTDFTDLSTIGSLFVDDVFECFVLEDKDRGLSSDMNLDEIREKKVPGQTCIPIGTYFVTVTQSQRFGRILPLVCRVNGFDGIRIHPGNAPKDTEGCLLPGKIKGIDFVGQSKEAFDKLFGKILGAVTNHELVELTIDRV